MSTNVGEKALAGFDEYIIVCCFEIKEEMTLEFKGLSCNIENPDGPDEELGPEKEVVRRKVYPGYRCYVMRSVVSFLRTPKFKRPDTTQLREMSMSTNVGERALAGFDEYIIVYCFEITEEMTLEFKGLSCNIENPDGPDEELGPEDEVVRRKVYVGYRCYVLKAWMRFEKVDQTDQIDRT